MISSSATIFPAHKAADDKELIEARGATLKYLPVYSPGLNPIEQVFAKPDALLRKSAERSCDKLWQSDRPDHGSFPRR
ncbi:transposase [Methylobacter svalbardensis]|uniref:transposase n=1 Tax=Methylobacter svalbardensis TaxID=3080016 RepID=UPI0030EF4C66